MINYTEKSIKLHDLIRVAGYKLSTDNTQAFDSGGNQSAVIDAAVQAIIDSYDPFPNAQAEAILLVNEAAGIARAKYVTNIPSQDTTYQLKLDDANAFMTAGYPEASLASYPFVELESVAINSNGQVAANLILSTANNWITLAANIEKIRRVSNESIKAELDWQNCKLIADAAMIELEAI